MTIQEMHIAFDIVADIVATRGYPGLEPEERDFYLNRAIERFVKTRYSGVNPKKESFEQSQKRIEDLRTLLTRNTITRTSLAQTSLGYEWRCDLPTGLVGSDPKYLFIVSSNIDIDRDECGNVVSHNQIKTKQMTHDQKEEYLSDPYHKPDYYEALILFEGDFVYIYTNGVYNILAFDMIYLRYPVKVSLANTVDCDLPEHTHQEIVDEAVRLYVVGLGDQAREGMEGRTIQTNE